MELLGSLYTHMDLENHGFNRSFYWNLHLDPTPRVQVLKLLLSILKVAKGSLNFVEFLIV